MMSGSLTAKLTVPVNESDRLLGSANAPVTLVEYGDYECPHCKRAHLAIKQMQQRLGDRLCYVFRNFPLTTIHTYAQYAAELAAAAAAQGRFWEIHNFLFENPLALADGLLIQYAAFLGIDVDRFEREVAEHVYAERVRQDLLGGVTSGVNGTPTFFINGVRFNSTCTEMLFATAIAASSDVADG